MTKSVSTCASVSPSAVARASTVATAVEVGTVIPRGQGHGAGWLVEGLHSGFHGGGEAREFDGGFCPPVGEGLRHHHGRSGWCYDGLHYNIKAFF